MKRSSRFPKQYKKKNLKNFKQAIWFPNFLPVLFLLVTGVFVFVKPNLLHAVGTTFTVDSTLDTPDDTTGDGICDDGSGNCTLRAALEEATSNVGIDTVEFNIPGGGAQTITISSELTVADGTIVDGSTQPGSDCGDLWNDDQPTWNVIVESNDPGNTNFSGIVISGTGAVVRGLKFTGFSQGSPGGSPGIDLGGTGNTVTCNYITESNKGIRVGGSDHVIGGTTPGDGNVIGETVDEAMPMIDVVDVTVQGNFISSDPAGTTLESNGAGINLEGAIGTIIGGTASRAKNLLASGIATSLSPNTSDPPSDTTIQGNYIGVGLDGETSMSGYSTTGIYINNAASNTTIGGLNPGETNLIRGNGFGVRVGGDATDVVIQGNIISDNSAIGIEIVDDVVGTIIQGNYIGVDATGEIDLGNGTGINDNGINTVIGGTNPGEGNVISGSLGPNKAGIDLIGGSGALVQGNYIGTNASGDVAIPNRDGIWIHGATNVTIGGTSAGARNIISGNDNSGMTIQSDGTIVQGNYIGIAADGITALRNGDKGAGINIAANSTTIGGTTAGARNIVVGGYQDFGAAMGLDGNNNVVQGNYFNTDSSGTTVVPGILGMIVAGDNNSIGGSSAGAKNVIAASLFGILLADFGTGTTDNVIQGNNIGIGADNTTSFSSLLSGVIIVGTGTANNMIGGTNAGEGNVIANSGTGINAYDATGFLGPAGTGNAFLGNSIYNSTTLGIDLSSAVAPAASDIVTANDTLDADTGPNGLQNYPVLTSAAVSDGQTTISGTLNSEANATFRIEFFSNPTSHATLHGEGQTYLGTTTVITNGSGNVSFTASGLTATTLGYAITATASKDEGSGHYSTSEFSANVTATTPSATPPTPSGGAGVGAPGGGTIVIIPPASIGTNTQNSTPPTPPTTDTQPTNPSTSSPDLGSGGGSNSQSTITLPPRSISLEQQTLPLFRKLFDLIPSSPLDWKMFSFFTYFPLGRPDTMPRDLALEQKGIEWFVSRIPRLPASALDWRAVNAWAYGGK